MSSSIKHLWSSPMARFLRGGGGGGSKRSGNLGSHLEGKGGD